MCAKFFWYDFISFFATLGSHPFDSLREPISKHEFLLAVLGFGCHGFLTPFPQ